MDVFDLAKRLAMRTLITDAMARRIAAEWHSGQSSAMYSFCSSGYVNKEDLLAEIADDLSVAPDGTERRELLALDKYINAKEDGRKVLDVGWSNLWDDTSIITEDML